jgi:hypothetical protein
MSDIELTPEQWRMCRQAGASFADESPTAVDTPHGQQLMIGGLGPVPGDLFRNRHTGDIGCIVKIAQRQYAWATLRVSDRLTTIPVGWLGQHWDACRPDGSLL